MKLPMTIKIGAHKFQFVLVDQAMDGEVEVDGQVTFETCKVEISRSSEKMINQTIIHELLHVVDFVYNASKLDEDTVERLSQGIHQAVKDNKVLIEVFK